MVSKHAAKTPSSHRTSKGSQNRSCKTPKTDIDKSRKPNPILVLVDAFSTCGRGHYSIPAALKRDPVPETSTLFAYVIYFSMLAFTTVACILVKNSPRVMFWLQSHYDEVYALYMFLLVHDWLFNRDTSIAVSYVLLTTWLLASTYMIVWELSMKTDGDFSLLASLPFGAVLTTLTIGAGAFLANHIEMDYSGMTKLNWYLDHGFSFLLVILFFHDFIVMVLDDYFPDSTILDVYSYAGLVFYNVAFYMDAQTLKRRPPIVTEFIAINMYADTVNCICCFLFIGRFFPFAMLRHGSRIVSREEFDEYEVKRLAAMRMAWKQADGQEGGESDDEQ